MGKQHTNGRRVSRHRLAADVTVGVIANPMSGRDIRRLVASASVFPNAEKASMHALWLVRGGHPTRETAVVLGVDERTVQRWLAWYRVGGLTPLEERHAGSQGHRRS